MKHFALLLIPIALAFSCGEDAMVDRPAEVNLFRDPNAFGGSLFSGVGGDGGAGGRQDAPEDRPSLPLVGHCALSGGSQCVEYGGDPDDVVEASRAAQLCRLSVASSSGLGGAAGFGGATSGANAWTAAAACPSGAQSACRSFALGTVTYFYESSGLTIEEQREACVEATLDFIVLDAPG